MRRTTTSGNRRKFREIRQEGPYSYVFSPYNRPIATVTPGETIVLYCEDAFESKIKSERAKPSDHITMPYVNPQTGPLYVEGALKGDALAVNIRAIEPTRDYAISCLIPYFGGLTCTPQTAMLHEALPEKLWFYPIKNGLVHLRNGIRIPYEPFLGTIGTSPEIEAISSLVPSWHGGNMDAVDTCPGNTVLLPVFVEGALFYTGDAHAAQGDGELCGVACEITSRVTLTIDLIKNYPLTTPRIISSEYLMSCGSMRPLEDAARIAWTDLIQWLVREYRFNKWAAYQLLTQAGRLRLGNMVDPNYTMVAKCPRKYLPKTRRKALARY